MGGERWKLKPFELGTSRIFLNWSQWMAGGHWGYLAFWEAMISHPWQSDTSGSWMRWPDNFLCRESPHLRHFRRQQHISQWEACIGTTDQWEASDDDCDASWCDDYQGEMLFIGKQLSVIEKNRVRRKPWCCPRRGWAHIIMPRPRHLPEWVSISLMSF